MREGDECDGSGVWEWILRLSPRYPGLFVTFHRRECLSPRVEVVAVVVQVVAKTFFCWDFVYRTTPSV